MNAKKILFVVIIVSQLFSFFHLSYAVVADPNQIVEFRQPDGTKFNGRWYGDKFLLWAETEDGYAIIKNFQTGYWCYAIKDIHDSLISSDLIVGKDNPHVASLIPHLKPSLKEFSRAEQLRQQRNQVLTIESTTGPMNLGIILIQFADSLQNPVNNMGQVKIAPSNTPPEKWTYYSNFAYTEMIYSTGTYSGLDKHPDHEKVFGSMNDYYLEVSYGNASIVGDVLNNIDPNTGRYKWLGADYNKSHYESLPGQNDDLIIEAIQKAEAAHQNNPEFKNPDDYYYICVLYAGPREGGSLYPHPTSVLGHRAYNNSEKWPGGDYPHFNHIGIHCHEFAHLLGLHDKYDPPVYVAKYGLMGYGVYNGPLTRGECPAHITCSGKIDLGWITPTTTTSNMHVQILPLETNSTNSVYKLEIDSYRYYLLENRQYTGFDLYLKDKDKWEEEGGLLIWYLQNTSPHKEELKEADNGQDIAGGDFFPGATNNTEFSGITEPSSNYDSDILGITYKNCASGISVKNINIAQALAPVEADIALNEWAGNIQPWRHLTWQDEQYIIGSVDIFQSSSITMQPSTVIQFFSGTRLTINGTLYADGATFSSASSNPGSGDWYGIVFDSADNSSYIKNSTIEYATYGIECIDCSPMIGESGKPNTIQYNSSNGVRCHQASPAISYNTIQHNAIGIYCEYNSNPDIAQNYVIDNNSYGIFCTQTCNPYIRHNEVSNNGPGGIACLNSSSPNLIGKSSNEPYGANKIISNGGNGVMAQSNSDPNLGFHLGYQAGYNDIYDNSNYQVANYTSNTIFAWKNWWGTSNPGSGLFTGSVDYSAYLSSSSPYAGPDWRSSLGKTLSDNTENTLNEAEEYLQRALELEGSAA